MKAETKKTLSKLMEQGATVSEITATTSLSKSTVEEYIVQIKREGYRNPNNTLQGILRRRLVSKDLSAFLSKRFPSKGVA